MKNLSFLIMVLFISLGCKEQSTVQEVGSNVSGSVNVVFKDDNGENLLDPSNVSVISTFKIYYLINGKKVLFSKKNLDSPAGYSVIHESGEHFLKVFLNTPYEAQSGNNETITYLEVDNNKVYEIKSLYTSNQVNISCEKLWLDGTPVWDYSDGSRKIEIQF